MGTILITNLAPIDDTGSRMFETLFEASLAEGHQCVFWSCIHREEHSPYFLPMRWDIGLWENLFSQDALKGYRGKVPPEAEEVWLPRLDRLCKQSVPRGRRRHLLSTLYAVSRAILDRIRPDLVLSWNPLCPHTGVLASLCRNRRIPVLLLERGPLPNTWYLETGGLLGHGELAGKSLESLVPEKELPHLLEIGKDVLRNLCSKAFNSYPQRVGTERFENLAGRETRDAAKIAFFPPDDTSLGFSPSNGRDRIRSLPGYESSYAAAIALASSNPGGNTLFKPHPSFMEETFPDVHESGLVLVEEDFRRLIDWSHVVATTGSGLQLLAMAADRPVISMGVDLLVGKGITYEAPRADVLPAALADALRGTEYEKRYERFLVFMGFLMHHYLLSMHAPYSRKPDRAIREVCRVYLSRSEEPARPEAFSPKRDRLVVPEGMALT